MTDNNKQLVKYVEGRIHCIHKNIDIEEYAEEYCKKNNLTYKYNKKQFEEDPYMIDPMDYFMDKCIELGYVLIHDNLYSIEYIKYSKPKLIYIDYNTISTYSINMNSNDASILFRINFKEDEYWPDIIENILNMYYEE